MGRLTQRFWFGEVLLAAFFGTVIVAAALLSPSNEAVSLFGLEIPVVCGFRQAFGIGCPGCGLTRSFTYMAHGDPITAFHMNWIGPVLFLAFASQPPYRLYKAWRDIRANGFLESS